MNYLYQIALYLQIISAFLPVQAFSQESAVLNCINVQQDGSVILSWSSPVNISNFSQYEIYYSVNGGAFNLETSISDVTTLSYNHLASNANLGSRYYFIKTVYNNTGLAFSDTLQSIFLQLDNNMPDFNQADLYWHAVSDPLPTGSSSWYKIYQEYPIGTWTLKDSINGFFYSEPVIVCNDSISYQIVIENSTGCVSASNIQGAPFYDVSYPLVPVFDSVSSSPDGFPVLGWSASESEDVTGYIIYKFENSNWVEIDRIQGRDSTFYIDSLSNSCDNIIQYALAAIDSCGNKSPGTFLTPRQNMTLESVIYNPCGFKNNISWTEYINAEPSLEGYKIFSSEDGNAFVEVGQTDASTLNFDHIDLNPGSTYTYYIQAYYGTTTSSTCRMTMFAAPYRKPEYLYFANADILTSGQAELTIEVDTNVSDNIWQIWRIGPNGGSPILIETFLQEETNDYPIQFTDEEANGSEGYYQYFANVIDSCETEDLYSNELKTIFLSVNIISENTNLLEWNAFEGWDAKVDKYYIYRMINDVYPSSPIDSVSSEILEYTDDVSSLEGHNGRIVYWVQAVEKEGNIFGFKEHSNSNQTLVATETDLYMPNAFKLNGLSPEFKPVFLFFGGTTYLFQIYSRWGNLIFETNDPDMGWNGEYKGTIAQQGIYSYKLAYKQLDGEAIVKTGTVTLIY